MRYLNFSMVGFVILTLGKLLGRKLLRIRGSIILSVGSGFILNYQTTSIFELSSCIDVELFTTWICKALSWCSFHVPWVQYPDFILRQVRTPLWGRSTTS